MKVYNLMAIFILVFMVLVDLLWKKSYLFSFHWIVSSVRMKSYNSSLLNPYHLEQYMHWKSICLNRMTFFKRKDLEFLLPHSLPLYKISLPQMPFLRSQSPSQLMALGCNPYLPLHIPQLPGTKGNSPTWARDSTHSPLHSLAALIFPML